MSCNVVRCRSMSLNGAQWQAMSLSGAKFRSVSLNGAPRRSMTLNDARCSMALNVTQCLSMSRKVAKNTPALRARGLHTRERRSSVIRAAGDSVPKLLGSDVYATIRILPTKTNIATNVPTKTNNDRCSKCSNHNKHRFSKCHNENKNRFCKCR